VKSERVAFRRQETILSFPAGSARQCSLRAKSISRPIPRNGGRKRPGGLLLIVSALLLACPALASSALEGAQEPKPDTEKLAPYYPTPELVVERMLRFAGLKPGEKLFDLGSGDGRIVIIAAQKFGADATGVEIDPELVKQSSERIHRLGLDKSARIIRGDLLRQDYSAADVLAVYLLPRSNERLRPMLEKQLRNGTRIVAHDFVFRGWTPEREEYVEDDGAGRSHTLYLYVIHK
jgi:predicted O-methyltransferase YrrM